MSKLLSVIGSKKQIMYATIKGTLTENDGVFSGFSGTNYLELQNNYPLQLSSFELNISFSFSSFNTYYGVLGYTSNGSSVGIFAYPNGYLHCILFKTKSNTTPEYTISYDIRQHLDEKLTLNIKTNGNKVEIKLYNENTLVVNDSYENQNLDCVISSNITYGKGYSLVMSTGSIDLSNSYIKLGATKYNLQAVVGYTVVGSPTITDGVVSGFTNSDYLKLPSFDYANSNNWEMIVAFELDNLNNDTQTFFDNSASKSGLYIYLTNQQKILFYGSDGTNNIFSVISNALLINQKYYIKIKFTGTSYIFYLSTDKVNWTIINTVETIVKMNNVINFSVGYSMRYSSRALADGKIYIAETIIYKDEKLWFNGYEG